MDEVARSNCEGPSCVYEDAGRGCHHPGMPPVGSDIRNLIHILQAFPPVKPIFTAVGVLLSVRILSNMFAPAIVIQSPLRQLRTSVQAKTHFSRSLSA